MREIRHRLPRDVERPQRIGQLQCALSPIVVDSRGFTLLVTDDGPGVPPAEMPRLGERTFRTDEARQRDPSGSGLGLAITSEICKRCGWKLAFEPHEPRGLRVSIAGPTGPL
jgi:signal transduction histidine kinase